MALAVRAPPCALRGYGYWRQTGVRFDDRIKTVLEHPVAGDRDRAVRWRQLIDLLSKVRADSDPALVARALEMALADRDTVPDAVRAATARSIAGRPVDARLVALFAADRLDVAAPLLAATTLDDEGRAQVAAVASEEVRRLFFALDGAPLPPAPEPLELTEKADTAAPSIGEMVARIERRRKDVEPEVPAPTAVPVAGPTVAPEAPTLFRWESDSAGAIAWVDGAPRAALIGRVLAGHRGEALMAEESRALLNRRAPFVDVPMMPAAPFTGEWRVSGAPAFSTGEGRFVGYRGIARRIDLSPPKKAGRRKKRGDDADSLRELVHEIKTPLNAIIGFAEIIDGQFLGPAHRNYRQRAAGIVSQARTLLAAVEDLDLAAKLQSRSTGAGTQFAEAFPPIASEMTALAGAKGVGLDYHVDDGKKNCALEPELAERMVRRFLTAVIDAAVEGEKLSVDIRSKGAKCSMAVNLPAVLVPIAGPQFFDADATDGTPAGVVFAFRLVRGLAQTVGGDVTVDRSAVTLFLPAQR